MINCFFKFWLQFLLAPLHSGWLRSHDDHRRSDPRVQTCTGDAVHAQLCGHGEEREDGGTRQLWGRGLHSSTLQLNLSAFCVTGGADRGCFGVV